MSFVLTTNYSLKKPDVNTEIDAWGDDINANFDTIDARMKLNADAAAAASTLAGTKAAASHTHAATDLASGTIAAARMPALTGDVTTSVGAVATSITAAAVVAAKLATMPANTVIGSITGTGAPVYLTAAQLSTIVTAGGGGTVADDSITNVKLNNMAQNTIKGRVTASTGDPEDLTSAQVMTILNTSATDLAIAAHAASVQKFCAVFKFDAGASVIPVGSKDEIYIPFAGTITGWTILTDVAGTITFDLWGLAYASFPPTVANTITAAAKPLIGSSARSAQSSTLTGWTTTIGATQTLICNVDACATIKRATLILEINKTA
jgi:hypothetical protein